MPEAATRIEPTTFPMLPSSTVIGLFSLLHITFASLAVAFIILAPIFEWRGQANRFYLEAARSLTRFAMVTFSTSLVLAVFVVELLIGLFPLTNSWIFNRFRYPIYFACSAFVLGLLLLQAYHHFWEPIRRRNPGLHLTLGFGGACLMLTWVAILDGMGSSMLTPVETSSPWENLLNPTWIALVIHRLFGDFVFAGFALTGYAGWMLGRREDPAETLYYGSLLKTGFYIGTAALFIQPATGLLYALRIQEAVPKAFHQAVQGRYQPLVYLQFTLVALLFVENHLLLNGARTNPSALLSAFEKKRLGQRGSLWGEGALLLSALLIVVFAAHPWPRRFFTLILLALSAYFLYLNRQNLSTAGAKLNRPTVRRSAVALGISGLLLYWTMGIIRETARRPDTVLGKISLKEEAGAPKYFVDLRAVRPETESRAAGGADQVPEGPGIHLSGPSPPH